MHGRNRIARIVIADVAAFRALGLWRLSGRALWCSAGMECPSLVNNGIAGMKHEIIFLLTSTITSLFFFGCVLLFADRYEHNLLAGRVGDAKGEERLS